LIDWRELSVSGRPSIVRRHLTSAEMSSKHSKRSLDTAMFLRAIQVIHHWDNGVTTMKKTTKESSRERTQVATSHKTR